MKVMKVQINAEQSLDEVVKELDRLGFHGNIGGSRNYIITSKFGKYTGVEYCNNDLYSLTTLQQLREM